ncbi:MAG: hypothetical protein WKF37_04915 [Bryobacteraceae bacterium]
MHEEERERLEKATGQNAHVVKLSHVPGDEAIVADENSRGSGTRKYFSPSTPELEGDAANVTFGVGGRSTVLIGKAEPGGIGLTLPEEPMRSLREIRSTVT